MSEGTAMGDSMGAENTAMKRGPVSTPEDASDPDAVAGTGSAPDAAARDSDAPALDPGAHTPALTIVIPVHDAAPWLSACLDSILRQEGIDPADLEVIAVDDASTDESSQILARYAADHANLRVATLPACAGVSAARNRGLALARGRYVGFADADDWVEPQLAAHALAAAEERDSQMLIYGFFENWGDGREAPREMCEDPAYLGRTFSIDEFEPPSTELVTPNVWRILFERSFIEDAGLRYHDELRSAEDLAFIYEALFAADRVALLPERLYHYRQDTAGSLTHGDRQGSGFAALARVRETVELGGWKRPAFFRHFANLVLDVAWYSMRSASSAEELARLFDLFCDGWLRRVQFYRHLVDGRYLPFLEHAEAARSALDLLFWFYREESGACDRLRGDVFAAWCERDAERGRAERAEAEVAEVRASRSYRLGNAVMAPLAGLRGIFGVGR